MAGIAGIDLPREEGVEISLTYIFRIGRSTAQEIPDKTGVDYNIHVRNLTEAEEAALRDEIDHYTAEGGLRRDVAINIRCLREINCYRDIRHHHGFPVRGQRAKTSARTRKGPGKLVAKEK